MTLWLSNLPLWLCAFLVVGVTTTLTMVLTVLVRHLVGYDKLATNNEVAGFKFAVLGVVYAVLLGFAVITAWEKFRDAQEAVTMEAASTATVYRLAGGLSGPTASAVRAGVRHYLTAVLAGETLSMEHAQEDVATTLALNDLYTTALTLKPANFGEAAVFQQILGELAAVTEARRERLELSAGTVPGIVWSALLGGAILNVAFALFFGTRHVAAQVIMAGMLSAVIFTALFVVVMINYPFSGAVRVSMEPLHYVLENLSAQD
jgi:Protein of unknown function (DUF4239)